MDSEIDQNKLLLEIFKLVFKSGVCPDSTPSELLKSILHMHNKGYLYVAFENDSLCTVVGAYLIKEFNDVVIENIPEVEEGDILYIPFLVNTSKDKLMIKRLLSEYLDINKNVKEVIFYERNSDDRLKRFSREGVSQYVEKETTSPEPANA